MKIDYDGVCVHISLQDPEKYFSVVQVELLNQLEDKNHYLKTMESNEEGQIEFKPFIHDFELSCGPVNNTQYLKNGCFYFRISLGFDKSLGKVG